MAGQIVGQHDLYGNILFVNNEEKYPVVNPPEPPVKEPKNPLQGEFILQKPWTNEYNPIPYRGTRGRSG